MTEQNLVKLQFTKDDNEMYLDAKEDSETFDAALECDGVQLHFNSAVVSRHSCVFRSMLESRFKEGVQRQIVLHEYPLQIVQNVLQLLSSGETDILIKDLHLFFRFSDAFHVPSLTHACLETLYQMNQREKKTKNMSEIAQKCLNINLDFQVEILALMLKNEERLDEENALFLEANCKEVVVRAYLGHPLLVCDSEAHVLTALVNWCLHLPARVQLFTEMVRECININNISQKDVEALTKHPSQILKRQILAIPNIIQRDSPLKLRCNCKFTDFVLILPIRKGYAANFVDMLRSVAVRLDKSSVLKFDFRHRYHMLFYCNIYVHVQERLQSKAHNVWVDFKQHVPPLSRP